MKWIVALAILIELPLLYLFIGLTGTAGQAEPVRKAALILAPSMLCGMWFLYRIVGSRPIGTADWIAAVVALAPVAVVAYLLTR